MNSGLSWYSTKTTLSWGSTELHAFSGEQVTAMPGVTVSELHAGSPSSHVTEQYVGLSLHSRSTELQASLPRQSNLINPSAELKENVSPLHFLSEPHVMTLFEGWLRRSFMYPC